MESHFAFLLIVLSVLTILTSVGVFIFGRRLEDRGVWFLSVGLFFLVGLGAFGWVELSRTGFSTLVWFKGWIGRGIDPRGIHVGLMLDTVSATVAIITPLFVLALLSQFQSFIQDDRAERTFSGLLLAVLGVVLSWSALTIWISICGIALSVFGGILSVSAHIEEEKNDAKRISRFSWESLAGIFLLVLGSSMLVVGGTELRWDRSLFWLSNEQAHRGMLLVFLGALAIGRVFPFLGWSLQSVRAPFSVRAISTHLLLSWSVLGVVFRLRPAVDSISLSPVIGSLAFIFGLLSFLTGLSQSDWKKSILCWWGGGQALVIAILMFVGQTEGFLTLIAVSSGMTVFVLLGEEVSTRKTTLNFSVAAKGLLLTSLLSVSGALGFVHAGVLLRLFEKVSGDLGMLIGVSFFMFVFVVTIGRIVWSLFFEAKREISLVLSLACVGLILLSIGVVWTGSLTGGVLANRTDVVWKPLLETFFGGVVAGGGVFPQQSYWIYALVLTAGLSVSYWTRDLLAEGKPSKSILFFFREGFFIDEGFSNLRGNLVQFASVLNDFFVLRVWNGFLIPWSQRIVMVVTGWFRRLDWRFHEVSDVTFRKVVSVPAKSLQLMQSGDLQWYLCVVIGVGFVILIHFLRS